MKCFVSKTRALTLKFTCLELREFSDALGLDFLVLGLRWIVSMLRMTPSFTLMMTNATSSPYYNYVHFLKSHLKRFLSYSSRNTVLNA